MYLGLHFSNMYLGLFCCIGYMTDLGWGLNSVCHIGWFLAFLNFLLVIKRERRKKPPVPTRVLPIYFKNIPCRVIDIKPKASLVNLSEGYQTEQYPAKVTIPLMVLDRSDL